MGKRNELEFSVLYTKCIIRSPDAKFSFSAASHSSFYKHRSRYSLLHDAQRSLSGNTLVCQSFFSLMGFQELFERHSSGILGIWLTSNPYHRLVPYAPVLGHRFIFTKIPVT